MKWKIISLLFTYNWGSHLNSQDTIKSFNNSLLIMKAYKNHQLKNKDQKKNNNYNEIITVFKQVFLKYKKYETIGYSLKEKNFINNKDPNFSIYITSHHGKNFSQLLTINIFKDAQLGSIDFVKENKITISFNDKSSSQQSHFDVNYNGMNFIYKKFSYTGLKDLLFNENYNLKSYLNFDDKEKIIITDKSAYEKIEKFFNIIINRQWNEELIKKYLMEGVLVHEGEIIIDNKKYNVYSTTTQEKKIKTLTLWAIEEKTNYITMISETKEKKDKEEINYFILPEINNTSKYS